MMSAPLRPRVSVVIVTYNSEAVIAECLSAIGEAVVDNGSIQIVLVDNHSTDRSLDRALAVEKRISIIRNTENTGFARAVNRGAQMATGDFLLLLNPDASIEGSAILALADDVAGGSVAIVAPLVLQDGGLTTLAVGRRPTILRMLLHESGLSRLGSRVPLLEGHHLFLGSVDRVRKRKVDWISGGCMMIRRSVWDELGGLGTRWFMYAEDLEFCLRAQRAGYETQLDPTILARHAVGGSTENVDGRMSTVWIENLYCTSLVRSPLSCWVWKLDVVGGFRTRQATIVLWCQCRPEAPRRRARRRARYGADARALWQAESTFSELVR